MTLQCSRLERELGNLVFVFFTWQRSSDLVVVANRNLINSLRVKGEWSTGGWEDWTTQKKTWRSQVTNAMKTEGCCYQPILPISCRLYTHLYESLQLFSELFDTEETSLFQHAWRGETVYQDSDTVSVLPYTHLKVYLFYPKHWCLHWWSAVRVWDNSESVQSNRGSGRSDMLPESPACSPKHLICTQVNSQERHTGPSFFFFVKSIVTFFSEHVSQHTFRFFTDQCAPEEKQTPKNCKFTGLHCLFPQFNKIQCVRSTLWWWSNGRQH